MSTKTVYIGIGRITVFRTQSTIQVPKPTLIHTFLYRQIKYGFLFTIINTFYTCIIRLSIIRIDSFNHAYRQILQSGLYITTKEFFSIHHDFFHFLAINFHVSVIINFSTWKFLDQFL